MRPSETPRWRRPLTAAALVLLWHGLLLLAWLHGSRPQAGTAAGPVLRAEWLNLALAPAPARAGERPKAPPARATPAAPRLSRPAAPAPPAPTPAPMPGPALEARVEPAATTGPATPSAAVPTSSAPAPLNWSPETLAEGLRRERQWQDRQGRPRPARDGEVAARRDPAAGTGSVLHETRQADGARWARVQGPLGVYCVRLPPPGSPLPEGPGPRLALPGNCP